MADSFFNLITEPWLPVQRRSGASAWIAPSQINEGIDEDPVVGFAWPRPDFNGAAHEFLIGLLATASAPSDDVGWEEWWFEPPPPEALEERFARLAHAFNLDGPGPRFLQDRCPLEEGAKNKQVGALLMDAPACQTLENNADLFVKRGGTVALCRAAAAMALYTLSAYAPTGGRGHRTSLRGGGPMTTLVVAEHGQGKTLWGRLWPNVETQRQIDRRATEATLPHDDALVFPWLAAKRTSQKGGKSTSQPDVHPLQAYWGMRPSHWPHGLGASWFGLVRRAFACTPLANPAAHAPTGFSTKPSSHSTPMRA